VRSGLGRAFGRWLGGVGDVSPLALIFIVCATVTFVTEIVSNVASANIALPVVAELAVAAGQSPMLLMPAATLACSFAFMLPVSTPPNAIVYSSRLIKVQAGAVYGR
jgi:solute carrier family 13 (sodium-dependent dicarboxylate transporter), member 2/3/5